MKDGMLPIRMRKPATFFFSEDRTSSADLETILGKDEVRKQGVCWLGFLEIPLVLGEAPPIDLCQHASRFIP